MATLILHNDSKNSIDDVIVGLMAICGHDEIQAEQCALLAHYKGSYEIKEVSELHDVTSLTVPLNVFGLKVSIKI